MDKLHEWGGGDIDEVVQLLLSEVVTNALLHAGSPVEVCVVRQPAGVRVEVTDQSASAPCRRDWAGEAATGRGLALVDALASAWGVQPSPDGGKIVWFTVGDGSAEPPLVGSDPDLDSFGDEGAQALTVELRGAPVLLFGAMHRHLEALLREWALLGAEDKDWEPLHLDVDLGAATRALAAAGDAGRSSANVSVSITSPIAEARSTISKVRDSLQDAQRRALAGDMLTPPALPEVRACLEWFLGELLAQLDGAAPTTWHPPGPTTTTVGAAFDAQAALDATASATIIADDDNRIVYANAAAEKLLGWDDGRLAGQRLTAIIPERLRDAHIAGFSRYQLTRVPRLIGNAVQVPALRQDGSEIEILLHLSATPQRNATRFVATIGPAERPAMASSASATRTLHTLAQLGNSTVGDVVVALCRVADWEAGCWWVPADGVLRCVAVWTERTDTTAEFTDATETAVFSPGVGLPGRVWKSGQVWWIPDLVADSNFPRSGAAAASGLRSACAFPVGIGESAHVVELFGGDIRPPDDDLIAAYTVAGPLLATLQLT